MLTTEKDVEDEAMDTSTMYVMERRYLTVTPSRKVRIIRYLSVESYSLAG